MFVNTKTTSLKIKTIHHSKMNSSYLCLFNILLSTSINRGGGTGEASEARASPEFRGFTTEKFLASWIYERGNFSCFTGKKLVPPPLVMITKTWNL